MAGNSAKVTLTLEQIGQEKIRALRRELEELAKLRSTTSSSSSDQTQANALRLQARALKEMETQAGQTRSAVDTVQRSLGGIGGVARAGFGGFLGGAGLGPIGGLLGALATGSVTGMVAAVGAIVGQATKMAYDFERTSLRASQALGIGTNAPASIGQAALRNAAMNLSPYIGPADALRAMTAFGAASGSTVNGTIAAGGTIAQYSKAYGLDPTALGTQIGTIIAQTGREDTASSETAGVFGAAQGAGPLGRRIQEFIGTATGVLSQLQQNDPLGEYSATQAAQMTAAISSMGGVFGTAAYASRVVGAEQAVGQGAAGNATQLARLYNAGVTSNEAIFFGQTSTEEQGRLLKQQIRYDGGINNPIFANYLSQIPGGGALYATLIRKAGSGANTIEGSLAAVNALGLGPGGKGATGTGAGIKSPEDEQKLMLKNLSDYSKTLVGGDEKLFADIQKAELKVGETVLATLSKSAAALDQILNGNIAGGLGRLIESNQVLVGALLAAAAAQVGIPMLKNLIGGSRILSRLAGGAIEGFADSAALGGDLVGGVTGTALRAGAVLARVAAPTAAMALAYWMYQKNSHPNSGSGGEEFDNPEDIGRDQGYIATHGFMGLPTDARKALFNAYPMQNVSDTQREKILQAAARFGVSPDLIYAEYSAERSYKPSADADPFHQFGLIAGVHGYHYGYNASANTFEQAALTNASMWAYDIKEMIAKGIPLTYGNIIKYHEKSYTPPGAKNDRGGLNKYKIRNVMNFLPAGLDYDMGIGGVPVPGNSPTPLPSDSSAPTPSPSAGSHPKVHIIKKTAMVRGRPGMTADVTVAITDHGGQGNSRIKNRMSTYA